jgi:hypothetical protein
MTYDYDTWNTPPPLSRTRGMFMPMENYDALVRKAEAADAYCAARKANEDAQPSYWMDALAEVDRTWHDLLVACGYEDVEA